MKISDNNEFIIKVFSDKMIDKDIIYQNAFISVDGQINPTGLVFDWYKFSELNCDSVDYISYIHEDFGVFCIIKCNTMFSKN